jgi:hypothetical protein
MLYITLVSATASFAQLKVFDNCCLQMLGLETALKPGRNFAAARNRLKLY